MVLHTCVGESTLRLHYLRRNLNDGGNDAGGLAVGHSQPHAYARLPLSVLHTRTGSIIDRMLVLCAAVVEVDSPAPFVASC